MCHQREIAHSLEPCPSEFAGSPALSAERKTKLKVAFVSQRRLGRSASRVSVPFPLASYSLGNHRGTDQSEEQSRGREVKGGPSGRVLSVIAQHDVLIAMCRASLLPEPGSSDPQRLGRGVRLITRHYPGYGQ